MNDFKIGDWVRIKGALESDIFKLTENEIKYKEIILGHFIFEENTWVHWQPKEGEWCWYKHCLVKVLSIRDTSYQVSAPMFGEQWTGSIELEPFTNQLPTYIKDK